MATDVAWQLAINIKIKLKKTDEKIKINNADLNNKESNKLTSFESFISFLFCEPQIPSGAR